MKVFVTGVCGQLGHDVVNELIKKNINAVGSDIQAAYSGADDGSAVTAAPYFQLDITDRAALLDLLRSIRPDAIVHCAAWTDVDGAEDESKRELVRRINEDGTANLADAAKELDIKMLYVSTDYVFDGSGVLPRKPDDDSFAPLNYYGETKLAGERAVVSSLKKYFIVRTAWVFGLSGKNFIKTMIALSKKYDEIRVVNDQIGTPTYTRDLARLIADMIITEKYGIYHATNEGGYISWAEFAEAIFERISASVRVIPVTTEQYGLSKAKRPFNSRLDKSKLYENGFELLPDWRDALDRYLKETEQF